MKINGYEITAFTKLSEKLCLKVLEIIEREFGEIGDFIIEDNEVMFCVYSGYSDNAPKIIEKDEIKLNLVEKSSLIGYKITIINNN